MINKIYNADNIDILKQIPDNTIDCIITDPPYEFDLHGGGTTNPDFIRKLVMEKHIDFISNGFDINKIFLEFERILKVINIIIFCSNKQISKIMKYWEDKGLSVTCLIWKKTNPIPFGNGKYVSDVEFIIFVRGENVTFNNLEIKEKSKVFEYPAPVKRIHPTQKPIKLIEKLIKTHTKKNDLIFDGFSGSGTTAIACHNTNRNFICCELDKTYYDKSIERLNVELEKNTLF